MRGEVEIYRGNELIYHEPNMLVDGAGKTIADIMTASPSLSGVEDHATSSILDSSNYTIQAISFGKDLETFSKYAHAYHPNTRNLLYDSTFSSVDDGTGRAISGEENPPGVVVPNSYLVSSLPWVTPPPGFEDTPSAVAHVTLLLDRSNTNIISFNHILNLRSAAAIHDVIPSGLQDKWLCYSMYFKPDPENYPWNLDSEDGYIAASERCRSEFKLQVHSPGYTTDPEVGFARTSILPYFDPETGDISSITPFGFYGDDRGDSAGFAMTDWNGHAGIQPVGDGWYRIWNSLPCPSACDYLAMDFYPAGYEAGTYIGESSGGCYTFGHQLELGRWPTPLQFTSGRRCTGWDLSGSVLNEWYGKYGSDAFHPIDKGTVRVVSDTSSLVVENTLCEGPNPESTRLETQSVQLLDFSSNFSSMEFGQNPNFIPFRSFSALGEVTREPYTFSAWGNSSSVKYCVDSMQRIFGRNLAYYETFWSRDEARGIGSLGNQSYYLGCYPEGSSTGGSTYAFVSDLTSSAAYNNPITSGTYYGTFNEASSMDNFGFVNMIMSSVPITGYSMSSTASGLCLSGPGSPAYVGPPYIEYSVTIGSGDVGYSNLYGGITKMALWTIDVPETLQAGNTPPFAFSVLNNPRKYRMFSTKHFSENICKIADRGSNPGVTNYDDLLIKWRIHFR